jgi:excisionase family DNA binding protein
MNENEDTKLLTVPAVAEWLSVSDRMAWDLVATGAIPSLLLGRSRRVSVASVRQYVKDQADRAMQPA